MLFIFSSFINKNIINFKTIFSSVMLIPHWRLPSDTATLQRSSLASTCPAWRPREDLLTDSGGQRYAGNRHQTRDICHWSTLWSHCWRWWHSLASFVNLQYSLVGSLLLIAHQVVRKCLFKLIPLWENYWRLWYTVNEKKSTSIYFYKCVIGCNFSI